MEHVAWPDTENFYNVRRSVVKYPHIIDGFDNTYRAKVKLHGMNAGVQVNSDGKVVATSRSMMLSIDRDTQGFAKWVAEREEQFREFKPSEPGAIAIITGEWCGPGIQKGVAVNQLPHKVLAVFAIRVIAAAHEEFITAPAALSSLEKINGVHVIPWFNGGQVFDIDWKKSAEELQPVIDNINQLVAEVEAVDPWVKQVFNIEGTGEGLVFYPGQKSSAKQFSDLAFKAKGEAHKVVARTKPVQADPTIVDGALSFADMVVTPARLEQGVRAINDGELVFDTSKIGQFLMWINKDVLKETQAELEASKLDQKTALKACSNKARSWYLEACKKL